MYIVLCWGDVVLICLYGFEDLVDICGISVLF